MKNGLNGIDTAELKREERVCRLSVQHGLGLPFACMCNLQADAAI